MSTVEVEGAVLVEFTSIDASARTLVRSLMFIHEQPASILVSRKATELFPHTLLRLPVALVPCLPGSAHDGRGPSLFLVHCSQATAAAIFFARAVRFGGCFPARLCSMAGLTITSISARWAST